MERRRHGRHVVNELGLSLREKPTMPLMFPRSSLQSVLQVPDNAAAPVTGGEVASRAGAPSRRAAGTKSWSPCATPVARYTGSAPRFAFAAEAGTSRWLPLKHKACGHNHEIGHRH